MAAKKALPAMVSGASRFLEVGDDACLFALEDACVEGRCLQDGAQHGEGGIALRTCRQRAHGDAGAVEIDAAAQRRADVGHLFGEVCFIELAGAEVEHGTGQRRGTRFRRRVER